MIKKYTVYKKKKNETNYESKSIIRLHNKGGKFNTKRQYKKKLMGISK